VEEGNSSLYSFEKPTSTGRRSDHYWSRREVVLVTIAYQYWSAQRPVLVHFISSTASRIEIEGEQTHIYIGQRVNLYWSRCRPI